MSQEKKFNCTLIAVNPILQKNTNGTEYAVATIEFQNKDNVTVQRSARIYATNLTEHVSEKTGKTVKAMEVGGTYQATATVYGENQVDVTVAPFAMGSGRATIEDFIFDEVEAPVLESVGG